MRELYPTIEPYQSNYLQVSDLHRVYYEQSGNPDGQPVIFVHGGPGGGTEALYRRFFDPATYRIILFDQRGAGKSRPHASLEENTTWHLVADIERIRELLGIDRWIVFGGSWGAALGLIYAIQHPEPVRQLVLRGVFLMTKAELRWFYGGGAGAFWPDLWHKFVSAVPAEERDDIIAAYARRLFSGDLQTETRYARAWAAWENTLASISNDGPGGDSPAEYARAFARLENHYFSNLGFLEHDGWIEANLDRLADVPGTIVQGRYDMICPPAAAYHLNNAWPRSTLRIVPRAGHALSEPGISAELVRIMDGLRRDG